MEGRLARQGVSEQDICDLIQHLHGLTQAFRYELLRPEHDQHTG